MRDTLGDIDGDKLQTLRIRMMAREMCFQRAPSKCISGSHDRDASELSKMNLHTLLKINSGWDECD